MSDATVTYAGGRWTGLVADGAWALVECSPDDASAHHFWRLMCAGLRPPDLLHALSTSGVIGLPGFAVVLGSEPGLVLVRGAATVRLVDESGEAETVSAADASTWTERSLTVLPSAVVLTSAEERYRPANIPTSSGVVASATVEVRWTGSAPEPVEPSRPQPGKRKPVRKRAAAEPGGDAVPNAVAPARSRRASPPPAPVPPSPEMTLAYSDPTADEPGGDPGAASSPSLVPDHAPSEYDDLFGRTEHRAVEDAARRVSEDDDEPATAPPSVAEPTAVPDPETQDAAIVDAAPWADDDPTGLVDDDPTGLIDAVPWSGATSPVELSSAAEPMPVVPTRRPPSPVEPDESGDDVDEHTTARASLPVPVATISDTMQPSVRAIVCDRGHANPPTANFCRLCGQKIAAQDVRVVPRPPLGELVLTDGTRVLLDRPVLFGRTPTWDGRGDERPNLVQLTSPQGDISRNHVLVSIDEWHVLIADLHSTNGTFLTSPGAEPQRLRGGEAVPMEPGSRVTLSDEVFVVYEVGG